MTNYMKQDIVMPGTKGSWKRGLVPIILLCLMMGIMGTYEFLLNNKVLEKGVFLKCIILEAKGVKGGGTLLTISYKFKNITYTVTQTNGRIGSRNVNTQFFIKVLAEQPRSAYILDAVPDCLYEVEAPTDGWKELPKCQ